MQIEYDTNPSYQCESPLTAQRYRPRRIIGVDIDIDLVHQCGETVTQAYALQKPKTGHESSQPVQQHYFPACFPQMYGPVAISKQQGPPHRPSTLGEPHVPFPRNIEFHAADWLNQSIETDEAGYDVILA